jgi:hypothetical protein
MAKITPQTVLFNAAGIGIGLFSVGYMIKSALIVPTVPPCTQRFAKPMEFALKSRTGAPMNPVELEARAGITGHGLRANASVVKLDGGPAATALNVKLAKNTSSLHAPGAQPGGINFLWKPSGMQGAGEACLSYSLFFPNSFDFGAAGVLPGLYGGSEPDLKGHTRGFATRLMWRDNGMSEIDAEIPNASQQQGPSSGGEIDVQIPIDETAKTVPVGQGAFQMPRGRWVAIEQELVLNVPGQPNGIVRVWVDGALKIERSDVQWRFKPDARLAGVIADVSYGGVDNPSRAPADTSLYIAGLTARWR